MNWGRRKGKADEKILAPGRDVSFSKVYTSLASRQTSFEPVVPKLLAVFLQDNSHADSSGRVCFSRNNWIICPP
jgi:hypothetical protein